MLINEKGKIFGRINVIDFISLLVIVLLIAGGIYKFVLSDMKGVSSNPDLLQYTVSINDVRNYSVNALNIDDKLYDPKTDTYMGKIIGKEVRPFREYITKTDGNVALAEKPQRYEILLTIEVPGVESSNGYLAGGNRDINRLSTIQLASRMIAIQQAKVVDVKRVK
ncbi:MAG: hypothetical protein A2Y23_06720 [Clostridiales bacterium GWB2_37_7]|nr:MAG: hypothetical protein A2Y23_06720 [Clostridiales bacterium GWB2_37_7]